MAPDEIAVMDGEVEVADIPRTYWLPDWLYVALKWCVLVLLPAVGVFYQGLAGIWGWPLASEITDTVSFVALFLGALIGISEVSGKIGGK